MERENLQKENDGKVRGEDRREGERKRKKE